MIMADLPSKVATSSRSCCFVIASTQRWYMTALCFFWMVCSSIAHVQSMRRSTFAYSPPPFFVVPGSSVGSHRIKCAGACVHSKGHSYNLLSHPHSEHVATWCGVRSFFLQHFNLQKKGGLSGVCGSLKSFRATFGQHTTRIKLLISWDASMYPLSLLDEQPGQEQVLFFLHATRWVFHAFSISMNSTQIGHEHS